MEDSKINASGNAALMIYGYCRDNAISAFGKIIKYQFEFLNNNLEQLIHVWISCLPLL